jgi:hypothetical protein
MQKSLKFILFLNIKIFSKVKFLFLSSQILYFDLFSALINDFSSSVPPNIYSFTPFIYNITVHADEVEVLVPCNQGNWIDCSNRNSAENSRKDFSS